MLQIKDICKEYRTGGLTQQALDHVNLSFRDSEFVAILGPSGSGKTTLLNIIGGLDRYDSGDLIINGVSTKRYTDRDWDTYRNHTIGFIFQSYNLLPSLTAAENVAMPLMFKGVGQKQRMEMARKELAKMGLAKRAGHKPTEMSGGQQQRVGIARAFVARPRVIFADEPTGNLDTATTKQVLFQMLQMAKEAGITFVMVTHEPRLAGCADRVITIQDGRVLSDVLEPPQIVEKNRRELFAGLYDGPEGQSKQKEDEST